MSTFLFLLSDVTLGLSSVCPVGMHSSSSSSVHLLTFSLLAALCSGTSNARLSLAMHEVHQKRPGKHTFFVFSDMPSFTAVLTMALGVSSSRSLYLP